MREHQAGSRVGNGGWRRLNAQLAAALTDHLRSGARPRLPMAGLPLWQVFAALSLARSWQAGTGQPIRWQDVQPCARLMGLAFAAHHVQAVMAMDQIWLARDTSAAPVAELTPEAFDMML